MASHDIEGPSVMYVLLLQNMFNIFKSDESPKTFEQTTCDFQQCCILTSVDSDEPVQPHFKLRNSK